MGNSPDKAVYTIRNANDQSYWLQIGVGFLNRDNSISVVLNALPLDGKLHIRDFRKNQGDNPPPSPPNDIRF